jgi:hypothetical protein
MQLAKTCTSHVTANGVILMPKFVIEREIAGAGKLPATELQAISQKSCSVLNAMGPRIQWVQSYVTDDKIYCVYNAPDADMIREHAKKGGFPANVISRVRTIIDPTTAEAS